MKWLVALFLFLTMNVVPALAMEEADRPTGAEQKQIRLVEGISLPESTQENDADVKIDMSLSAVEDEFDEVSPRDYYGYNTLKAEDRKNGNDKLEEAYEDLVEGIARKKKTINLTEHRLTADELKKVFFACLGDYPQFFWLRSGYSGEIYGDHITVVEPFYETGFDVSEVKDDFADWAQAILDASGVKSGMTDYEKAIMLHDELAERIAYDHDANAAYNNAYAIEDADEREEALAECAEAYPGVHSAYGALVKGRAVCDGYAKAYQHLLYKVGIVSHLATGIADGGGHAWNLVLLDGDWYYTDLTWDDDNSNGMLFHAYFNMTSAQSAESTHVLDNPYAMPTCTATRDNYFVKNGSVAETLNADVVAEQLRKGPMVHLYVTGSMNDAISWLSAQGNIIDAFSKAGVDINGSSWYGGYSRNELCIGFVCNKVGVHENMVLEIGSTTAKTVKIYQAFYDENDVLIRMGVTEGVALPQSQITKVKVNYTNDMDGFKKVKYFLWDGEGGLKPLYDEAEMEY